MTTPHEQMWAAIEAFTNTTRRDGRIIPSLWDQLQASIDTSAGNGGGRGRAPQSPLNTAVVSLVDEVERLTRFELLSIDCRPTGNIPNDLRTINNQLATWPNARLTWVTRITTWTAQATMILTPPEHVTLLRGHACLACEARTISIWNNGEMVVQPALRLIWADNDDPNLSRIDYIHCQACGDSRWTADLHLIAEHTAMLNLTTETLTNGVPSAPVDETRPYRACKAR